MNEINWMEEVNKRKPSLLENTQQFLRIKSVLDPSTGSSTCPFGEGIESALNYMLNKGEEHKCIVKNVDHLAGYIEYGEGEESVGILCHLDVVPAGDGWTTPPFSADIRDGKLYGRGAIDNKGPTMAAFYAMMIVKELGLPLTRRVRMILGTDEESDWRCVTHYFNNEEMPTVGFAPDADFPIIHAEKGITDCLLQFHANVDSEESLQLIEFHAGERFNMVPDEATVILKGNKQLIEDVGRRFHEYLKRTKAKGTYLITEQELTLTYVGKSVHGSTPEKGINAGVNICEFLAELSLQQGASHFIQYINHYFTKDVNGKKLGIFQEDEVSGPLTVNVGTIRYNDGVGASLGLNIRYPVTVNGEGMLKDLSQSAKQEGFSLQVKNHMEPSYVEKDHPLIQTLSSVYERQTGEKVELLAIGGGTYARALNTGVAFGPLFPGREEVAHQRDEYILIDDLLRATAIYAEAIYELAR
ncbi:dipeptidase PepV [Halalkalibacter urbisdiaboli]|uniref:dipeptidase PepV n=1 Tax=Halalkalibacter urbisdiaboli TaxID=1960589 RepID=UPI000B442254|nr:dipeptidase PepV [Halalkalibacter urbisdiaboli]